MKTLASKDNFVVCQAASDTHPTDRTNEFFAIEAFEHTSGIETALRALLNPHCVFENTIFFRRSEQFFKITRTVAGWTSESPVTDTREMHKACPELSNCIRPKDILTILGNDRCHA